MKCKNCGATVPKGSNLCINCGAVLNKSSVNFSDIPREEQKNEKKKHPGVKKAICISFDYFGCGRNLFLFVLPKEYAKRKTRTRFFLRSGRD